MSIFGQARRSEAGGAPGPHRPPSSPPLQDVQSNLSAVRQHLGVCPQHDVLWPDMTVKEHLELYAAVKGVPRAKIAAEVTRALQEVRPWGGKRSHGDSCVRLLRLAFLGHAPLHRHSPASLPAPPSSGGPD